MTPASRNPRVLSTLVFVFLAGAVVGALTMRVGLHERLHRTVAAASPPPAKAPTAETNNDPVLQRMRTQLNLSEQQTRAVAAVLSDYRRYYLNLEDQLDDIRSNGHERIMEVLNAEQRRQFEKMSGELQPGSPAK